MTSPLRFLFVSFDGLRPDLLDPALTPNLCRLQALGVTLAEHRTIYPSETRSAFPSFVTGTPTHGHGMVGNRYVDRSVTPPRYINTADAELLRQLDQDSGGRLMSAQSLGEILAAQGLRYAVLATNSAGTTRFFHHKAEDVGHIRLSGHFREACTPDDILAEAESKVGPMPPEPLRGEPDKIGQDWITSVLLDVVWPDHMPDVTVLSYGEPDTTSHFHGTGSETTRSVIAHCDAQFGRVLDWWEAEGRADGVQIVTISDHGHITGHSHVSVTGSLADAGFRTGTAPSPDVDVVVVPGQVGALYLADTDDAQVARVVGALAQLPWCGPIFTKAKSDAFGVAPGSLATHLVFANHERAPDVGFAFRADDRIDPFGLTGGVWYENNRGDGLGVHGGLHPKEMAALGIVAGDAFGEAGETSTIPTGICDFVPTLLHLLQIAAPGTMTGRVLSEVLAERPLEAPTVQTENFSAELGGYRQRLHRLRVDDAIYVSHGVVEGQG